MAAAGGSEAAAGGRRGPLGIPEAAFVVSGAGERGQRAGPGSSEMAFLGSWSGYPRGGVPGEWGRGVGAVLRQPARPREAAPRRAGGAGGRGWRRPFTASVLGLFPGEMPCFDAELALYLVRMVLLHSQAQGSEQRVVRALLAHLAWGTPCRSCCTGNVPCSMHPSYIFLF